MTLNKTQRKWLGIATIWITVLPILLIATWLFVIGNMFVAASTKSTALADSIYLSAIPFVILVLLQCPTMLVQVVLWIVYINHILKNTELSDKNRILVCLGVFFLAFVVMPVYFYQYIWRAKPAKQKREKKTTAQPPRINKRVLVIGVLLPLAILVFPFLSFAAQMIYGYFFQSPRFAVSISDKMSQAVNQQDHFSISYPSNCFYSDGSTRGSSRSAGGTQILCMGVFRLGINVNIRRADIVFDQLTEVAKWGENLADDIQNSPTNSFADKSINRNISTRDYLIRDENTILREYIWGQSGSLGASTIVRHCFDNYRFHNRVGFILAMCTDDDEFIRDAPIFLKMIENFAYLD